MKLKIFVKLKQIISNLKYHQKFIEYDYSEIINQYKKLNWKYQDTEMDNLRLNSLVSHQQKLINHQNKKIEKLTEKCKNYGLNFNLYENGESKNEN